MNNVDINPEKLLENKFLSSTPKFNPELLDKEKEKENFINSFEDVKIKNKIIPNKEISPFNQDFSLSSLLNEKNNEIDNNKNIINIQIENPIKKRIRKELISFGDKIDNEISLNNDDEIIYKEKDNTSSVISNKEKENLELKNNNSNQINNSESFQYNLPLENDKAPAIKDFFIFDEENIDDKNNGLLSDFNNINNKFIKENKEKNDIKENIKEDNNPINNKLIKEENNNNKNWNNEIIENKNNNINVNDNNNNNLNNNITYSKKKAKRSQTEHQSLTCKMLKLPLDEDNNLYSITKKQSRNSLINSCENSNKINKKTKSCINNASKENTKKLGIIKKLKLLNLPKIKEDDFNLINSYSSRDNIQRKKNILNINFNPNKSHQKKFKNLKFIKFPNLFQDFQKFIKSEKNKLYIDEYANTDRESTNYNNNKNILSKTNNIINYSNIVVGNNVSNINKKNYLIKKINNYNFNNKFGNNRKSVNLINKNYFIKKTRNFDDIIFNKSNKLFNNIFYNTINYENIETIPKEKPNKEKGKNKINFKNTGNKLKIEIHKPFQNYKNSLKSQNIHHKNIIKNKYIDNNNNKNLIANKTKNFNNNNLNNRYIKNKKLNNKKFYNKFIYNVFETNPNTNANINNNSSKVLKDLNNNNNIININNNKFINNNNSSKINKISKIKVNMILNKEPHKLNTTSNIASQENINNLIKIYRKPKNTCLINQCSSNDYNTITASRKKKFIFNNTNLTERNSMSKFDKIKEIYYNKYIQRSSMSELNVNLDKIYQNIGSENIIKLSILRNNLYNKISNEFSVTVGNEKNERTNNEIINNKNLKNKKTIINVNQYYPNYFINANNNNDNNNISDYKNKK